MPLDKKNFQGGLNRDDDSRVAPNGDYHYAQNVRVLSSEGRNAMLVENIRGTKQIVYNQLEPGEGEMVDGGSGELMCIGAYEDKPSGCCYYFIYSGQNYHRILEYNENTETIATVFRDNGSDSNQVLNFDKNTLITGINKIDDILYWTSDNSFKTGGRHAAGEAHNEPKYINVERAKEGWRAYYMNGNFNANPTTAFDIDTMYPYEFYSSNGGSDGNNASADSITGERKRKYVDVCTTRPHPPIYIYQTPIQNVSQSPFDPNPGDGIDYASIPSQGITYQNIPIDYVTETAELDTHYKKNNLYGFAWQFAYRYIYKDNEVGAYSEWSWMLPCPTYYSNKLDKDKQNFYNQIRIWYHNGPANVRKIEIVARKLNYGIGIPEEGNKGKFYLIATVNNYYYDSTYSDATANFTQINGPYGYEYVTTTNVPYIQSQASGAVNFSEGDKPPLGFLDFRNDGVTIPVDPVQFEKTYDRVPLRAKAQEVIASNRISYANYIDGFDNTPVIFDLMPLYGSDFDPIAGTNEPDNGEESVTTATGGTPDAEYSWDADDLSDELIDQMGWVEGVNYPPPNYPSSSLQWREVKIREGHEDVNGRVRTCGFKDWEDGLNSPACWNTDGVRHKISFAFPTYLEGGQVFNIKFNFRVRYKSQWGTGSNGEGSCYYPHTSWSSSWLPYKYRYFGAQLDLKYTVGNMTCSELIDEIISDIDKISQQTWLDCQDAAPKVGSLPSNDAQGASDDPESDDYNPTVGNMINHLYKTETYDQNDPDNAGPHTYSHTGVQAAAEMRMYARKSGGTQNILDIYLVPYGQKLSFSSFDPEKICKAGSGNDDGSSDSRPENDHREHNGCGVFGIPANKGDIIQTSEGETYEGISEDNYKSRFHDHQDGGGSPGSVDETNGVGDAFCKMMPPMIDQSGGTGGLTTNMHVFRDNSESDYLDSTGCDTGGGAALKKKNGCSDQSNQCGECQEDECDENNVTARYPSGTNGGFDYSGSGVNFWAGGDDDIWGDVNGSNLTPEQMMYMADGASAFKSGAWHRFGIVYYDFKGRSSMVQLQQPTISDGNKGSSCYVKFPTERIYKEGMDGIQSETLDNDKKKLPAKIGWKIYNQPPAWAEYYHWVYARNTSVGNFLWVKVDRAYINKGAKPGTSPEAALNDTKIYISLNTMDGRDWSYSERNRALIGDWSFAEGDRIRIITNRDGAIMKNPDTDIQQYYDFKLSEVDTYPGRFDIAPSADAADAVDGISDSTVLTLDSPVGGAQGEPHKAKPGKFLILEDPEVSGYGIADAEDDEVKAWRSCVIEIYRPKKIKEDETSLYYEFSERFPIINPGEDDRKHFGPMGNNSGALTTDADGTSVYANPAVGIFMRGDIWYKKRYLKRVDEYGNSAFDEYFCEDYFLNDFMNTNHNNIARPHLPSEFAVQQRRKASVTYSDVYQPDTQYNGLHSFPFQQRPYMDYDLSLGSIQYMVSRDTDLILLQEDKISKVLIDKNIINSPGGAQGITLSNNTLSESAIPFTGNYGVCLNPESVAVFGKVVYFVDIKRGAVLRLSNDGLTNISDYKMADYFRDKMDLYTTIKPNEYNLKLGGPLKIIGGYNPRHDEYIITFPQVYDTRSHATLSSKYGAEVAKNAQVIWDATDKSWNSNSNNYEHKEKPDKVHDKIIEKDQFQRPVTTTAVVNIPPIRDEGRYVLTPPETIGFSEKANRWTSYYTYFPDYYSVLNRQFISFRWGALFLHDQRTSPYMGMFHYDTIPSETRIDFAFNTDVSSVKSWNSLHVEGRDARGITPIVGKSISVSGTAVTGASTSFTSNDIELGDTIAYYTNVANPIYTEIGTVASITDDTNIVLTSSGGTLNGIVGAFVVAKDNTMYDTRFKTNINETKANHRLSYNNSNRVAGPWVIREDVGSLRIPYGITNTSGGEYFGLGNISSDSGNEEIFGSTTWSALVNGEVQGTTTNTTFTNAGVYVGDSIYYDNSGTETLLGVISTIDEDRMITLVANASASLANEFVYVKKEAVVEGDRLKGHYMETELTKRTMDEIQVYSSGAVVTKSELSNR